MTLGLASAIILQKQLSTSLMSGLVLYDNFFTKLGGIDMS